MLIVISKYHPPYHCTKQSFKRDGTICLLTHRRFKPFDPNGIRPALAHIIPHSVHGKVCIELSGLLLLFSPNLLLA